MEARNNTFLMKYKKGPQNPFSEKNRRFDLLKNLVDTVSFFSQPKILDVTRKLRPQQAEHIFEVRI